MSTPSLEKPGPDLPCPSNDAGVKPAVAASEKKDDVLERVVQSAHKTIDRLADTAAPHVQKLQEQVSSACEAWDGQASNLRAKGEEAAESLRGTVRDNPLVAVGAAFALGKLLARLAR